MDKRAISPEEKIRADASFNEILKIASRRFLPNVKILRRAYNLAYTCHADVRRRTGEPYIMHPLTVARCAADYGLDQDAIVAALLHDVVEDTDVSVEEIRANFNRDVAEIVDAVTKINKDNLDKSIDLSQLDKLDLENMTDEKLASKTAATARQAIYIKCLDRIHNFQTMGQAYSPEKQAKKIAHTRKTLIRLARQYNILDLAVMLEDFCLQRDNRQAYDSLSDAYDNLIRENHSLIYGGNGIKAIIEDAIRRDPETAKMVHDLKFQKRNIYSLYKECVTRETDTANFGGSIRRTTPLLDITMVVDFAYEGFPEKLFMGIYPELHESSSEITIIEIVNRKDGYSHYLLQDSHNNRFRLFIWNEAEYLRYTKGIIIAENELNQQGGEGSEKNEEEHIPVFLKDGTCMMVPKGYNVLDLAYRLHNNIGLCCKGAVVNGFEVPIHRRLEQGDKVEILSDYFPDGSEENKAHARIRHFEYLSSRTAIKALSRYLEKQYEEE